MNGHAFLRGLIEHIRKSILQNYLYPNLLTGTVDGAKVFYPEFIVKDDESMAA